MLEIRNGGLGLYCTEHLKCKHMTKLGFKGLILYRRRQCFHHVIVSVCLYSKHYSWLSTNFHNTFGRDKPETKNRWLWEKIWLL